MTATPHTFRQHFPEFSDGAKYGDPVIAYWLAVAYKMINADRWGDMTDTGAELYAAHNIVIEARAAAEAENGAVPGGGTGPINSKSIDRVSIGYDTSAAIEEGAGHWNLTVYGTRYFRFMKLFGAGPLYVGVGEVPANSGIAWQGPYV